MPSIRAPAEWTPVLDFEGWKTCGVGTCEIPTPVLLLQGGVAKLVAAAALEAASVTGLRVRIPSPPPSLHPECNIFSRTGWIPGVTPKGVTGEFSPGGLASSL